MALLVNGEYIDDEAIREESGRIRERLGQELPDESGPDLEMNVREWALDNLVEQTLLSQAARGFMEAQSALGENLTDDERVAAFIDHLTASVPRPNRREVSDYYRKNQILFLAPECVHASEIFQAVDETTGEAEALAVMEAAEAELRKGRPFPEVADQYSERGGEGGDLDWIPRGRVAEEWEAVVFALRPGQVSPIFRSRGGFHIAKLHGRKKAGVLPLREVYPLAEELMMKRRRDEAVERFIENVRAKSEIRRVARASVSDSL